MKITPIHKELRNSIVRTLGAAESVLSGKEYIYKKYLEEAVKIVSEYVLCLQANGEVSQRGEIPHIWNRDTIFESYRYPMPIGKRKKQLVFDWAKK